MTVEATGLADYSARTMKRTIVFGLLASAVFAGPAAAQVEMYPGQGITVNPAAANGRGDGNSSPYARNAYPDIIHLHMPRPVVHHHHVAAKPKPADVATAAPAAPTETTPPPAAPTSAPPSNSAFPPPLDTLTPEASTPAPAPAPTKHAHHAKAAEAPAPAPAASDGDSGQDAGLPLTLDPQAEHPVSQPPKHKHTKTASTEAASPTAVVSAAVSDTASGLTRKSQVLFARGDADISASTVNKMRSVASDLATLIGAGAQRVELDAYGGTPGDKSSDARRLSLKRALGVRELLIEDGVPPERIDVRALGGIDDTGAPDRVDIMVRGA